MKHVNSTEVSPSKFFAAALLILQFIFIWTTFFVLSSAINWPMSLKDPAEVALPRIVEHSSAVMIGYGFYLIAALLIVPATAALSRRLQLKPMMSDLLVGTAVISAIAKMIGIGRWLFVMPSIASQYVKNESERPMLKALFEALNNYAGGIGEIIGVSLATGVWTVLVGLAVLKFESRMSKAVGTFTVIAGLGLFLNLAAFVGLKLGPTLTLTNIMWQFSLLAVAVWSMRSTQQKQLTL